MDDNTAQKRRSQILQAAAQWQAFLANHPDAPQKKEDFFAWALERNIDPGYWWRTKEMSELLGLPQTTPLPYQQAEPVPSDAGAHALGGAAGAVGIVAGLLIHEEPEIMEEDGDFQKIADKKSKEWLKTNNKKGFESKEGLDYLYGSPDDSTQESPFLAQTEREFREKHKKKAEKYDKKKKKIYKNLADDPHFQRTKATIEAHAAARYQLAKKTNRKASFDEIKKGIEETELQRFVTSHPEKTAAALINKKSAQYQKLKQAQDAIEARKVQEAQALRAKRIENEIKALKAIQQANKAVQAPPQQQVPTAPQPAPPPPRQAPPAQPPQKPPSQPTSGNSLANRAGQAARNAPTALTKRKAQGKAVGTFLKRALLRTPGFWFAIGLFLLLMLIPFLIVFNGPLPQGDTTSSYSPIPGFEIILTAPSSVDNRQNIQYQVAFSYGNLPSHIPLESITVYNKIPLLAGFEDATGDFTYDRTNKIISWSLAIEENKHGFTFTLTPLQNDIEVTTTVFAETTVSIGTGGSGNACTQPHEGKGFCSVENLTKYFNGDAAKALVASMVCQLESRSNPFATNYKCPDNSIGLFQINLYAHCPSALPNVKTCSFGNGEARSACDNLYKHPESNIQKMLQISNNGANWIPWGAYTHSQVGVAKILRNCGIIK